eukprot:30294-Pelagococcus_subviridis.AAC.96
MGARESTRGTTLKPERAPVPARIAAAPQRPALVSRDDLPASEHRPIEPGDDLDRVPFPPKRFRRLAPARGPALGLALDGDGRAQHARGAAFASDASQAPPRVVQRRLRVHPEVDHVRDDL